MRYPKLILLLVLLLGISPAMAEIKKENYENGNLKTESVYVGGELQTEKRFRQDEQIEYEMHIKGEDKYEIDYTYHPDGKLFRQRPRVNGKIHGLEKDYYPSGKIKAQRKYVEGKKNGKAQGFYENGRVQGDWEFKDGVPVGATIYHPNGQVNLEHEFKDGRLDGVTKEYSSKGKLIAKRYYENDKLIKRVRTR